MNANAPLAPENYKKLMSSFGKEQENTFKRLETSIREIDSISPFLFGDPTPRLTLLLCKLYHENMVSIVQGRPTLRFMSGFLETPDGIYCTVSEDPLEKEDFQERQQVLVSLLTHANVTVKYPEDEGEDEPTVESPTALEWRTKQAHTENYKAALPATVCERLQPYLFMNEGATNYDTRLWETPMTVNFVNSNRYLTERRGGVSFPPFKRFREEGAHEKLECAYGSTCVESKLFSYVYGLGKSFNDVKGFVAYWIGKELPPRHKNDKYCYDASTTYGSERLNRITTTVSDHMDPAFRTYLESTYPRYRAILTYVSNPLSLPCAGCLANYTKYKEGSLSRWDPFLCGKVIRSGGRRSRRSRRSSRSRSSRSRRRGCSRRASRSHSTYRQRG